jgi:hypothetical protein
MNLCLHEGGHSGNDEKGGAPRVRLDQDNGNIVGLAIAYTIANADRELPGTVASFLYAMLPFAFRCLAA